MRCYMYDIFLRLLERKGVTVADVSRATGINQSTFTNWKNRNSVLSGKNATLIAEYFGVPVDYLMTGDAKYLAIAYAKETEATIEEMEMIKAFRSADDLTQQMILRLLGLEQDSDSKSLKEA